MFYFVFLCILIIFAVLEFFNLSAFSRKLLIFFSWLILVSIAGMRYETGGDWDIYSTIFDNIPIFKELLTKGSDINVEFGFVLLCSIVKQLGCSVQMVFFLVVLFNVSLLTKCLEDYYPKRILLGLMLYYATYYFALEFIYTRQSISVMICLFSLRYVYEKRIFKFLCCSLVALMFHRMSFLFLFFYPLLNLKFSKKSLCFLGVVIFLIPLFEIEWVKPVYLFVSKQFGDVFYQKALFYINSSIFGVQRIFGIGSVLNILIFLLFLLYRSKLNENKFGNIFFNLFVFNLVFYYCFYELVEISLRFRYYFCISLIFLFPMLIDKISHFINRLFVVLFVFLYAIAYNRALYLEYPQMQAYNPYQNVIEYKLFDKKSTGKQRLENTIKLDHQFRKGK